MFSLFRRSSPSTSSHSSASASSPPLINEPPHPPPPMSRHNWLTGRGRGKRKEAERGVGYTPPPLPPVSNGKGKGKARDEDEGDEEEDGWERVGEPRTGTGTGTGKSRSLRSRRSFRASKTTTTLSPPPPPSTSPDQRRPSSSAPPASTLRPPPQAAPPPRNSTLSLAEKLQELAVAHADGLLGEEEYRVLRAEAFASEVARGAEEVEVLEKGVGEGGLKVPRLGGESTPPAPTPISPSATLSPPTSPQHHRPSSVLSAQSRRGSVMNLFRRASVASRVEENGSSPEAETASAMSSRSGAVSPSMSMSNGNGAMVGRTRSIRNHPGQSSSALDLRSIGRSLSGGGESVFSHSTEGSYRRSPVTGYRSPSSLSPVKARTLPSSSPSYPHSHSHSHAFTSASSAHSHTSLSSFSRSPRAPLPPIPSSSDPHLFAATEREPSAQELKVEIGEIEGEWERIRGGYERQEGRAVEGWRREVGEEGVLKLGGMVASPPPSVLSSAPSPTQTEQRKEPTSLFRRASFVPPPSRPSTSLSPSLTPPPSHLLPRFLLPSSPSPLPSDLPHHLLHPSLALQKTVEDLRAQRQQTEERYKARIEFLSSKERGAEARERLRGR